MWPSALGRWAALIALPALAPARRDALSWDARAIFERGIPIGLQLSPDGAALELASGVLYEDDGPAAGFSYKPNEETLFVGMRLRKDFEISDARARGATLLVGPGGSIDVAINGKPARLEAAGKAGNYWQAYRFDPLALRAGVNDLVLSGTGKVWIARADEFPVGRKPAGRSRKSADAGKSWGEPGVAGEYYVRLFLDQYRPRGSVTLPVIDVVNLTGATVGAPVSAVGPVRLAVESEGSVRARARSGPVPMPDATWAAWEHISGALEKPAGRYVQIALDIATDDPLRTPRVRGLRVEAGPAPAAWTSTLRVLEARKADIVRTSVPFEYEPFDHPKLNALRQEHRLDEVVKGARGEFERITRLAAWASKRWESGHLREAYPPWDALEILKAHPDGKPVGGFCQQYNIVFLQACESFGISGRAVSIGPGDHGLRTRGGHEVVEVWSNEHAKWVYVDGNTAWYLADEETGTPLSLLELRERQLQTHRGEKVRAVRAVELAPSNVEGLAKTRHVWKGLADWPPFAELRLIPRSNFLEQPAPLPLNQGMRGWFWTGHHVWTDAASSASLLYANRVSRRGDFEWTLNQAGITLEALEAKGEIRVHLETVTPAFDTFLASTDGGKKKPVTTGFVWTLHPGRNSLEVVSRNIAGVEGPPSRVVIER